MAKKPYVNSAKTPAQMLLDLSGSWADSRDPDQIIAELKNARKNSKKLKGGF